MKNLHLHYFASWPYDDALTFMGESRLSVKKNPRAIFIGCGSHKETVITMGRHHHELTFLQASPQVLIRYLDRGGGITAHEPGQIVLYPIFSVEQQNLTIPEIINALETTMMEFLHEIGLPAERQKSGPGVFVLGKKLGFVGLRIKERIVQHGIAINLFNDAAIFKYFDPCGIKNLPITSAFHHVALPHSLLHYQQRLVYFFLRQLTRDA